MILRRLLDGTVTRTGLSQSVTDPIPFPARNDSQLLLLISSFKVLDGHLILPAILRFLFGQLLVHAVFRFELTSCSPCFVFVAIRKLHWNFDF